MATTSSSQNRSCSPPGRADGLGPPFRLPASNRRSPCRQPCVARCPCGTGRGRDVRPRLVRLVRDGVEPSEVEHVPRSGGHDPVETARLHGVKQTIEVAKALRQRRTRESIGGGGRRFLHHDRFSAAQPCSSCIVELATYRLPKQLTDISRGAVMCCNDDSTSPPATDRFLGGSL